MKIIFFGLGSIGKRHLNIIRKKYYFELLAFRSKKSEQNDLGINEIYSWRDVKKFNPDVAFITNPTFLHIRTAIKCLNLGMKVFIEKPLGSSVRDLPQLLKLTRKKQSVTYVAYNRRFHPVINRLKTYFEKGTFLHMNIISSSFYPDWREGDYKLRYTAVKKMGGGIILDLSHELDYTGYLTGGVISINGQFSKRSDLTVDSEDFADILVKTKSGPVNIHLNFFSQKTENKITVNFKDLTVTGDLINSTIEEWKGGKMIKREKFAKERNISFEAQLEYFFKNINNPKMMNNLSEAAPLFKKIINFKQK